MRGRRGSAAEVEGWLGGALEPLETGGEDDLTRTEVGSSSVARALFAIRRRLRDDWDDSDEDPYDPEEEPARGVDTMPAPPQSDIRMIGGQRHAPEADPLALYIDAIREPAVEIEPRTIPPPRQRRETVKLTMPAPMRPRQATLLMIDRPIPAPDPPTAATPLGRPTPAAAIALPRRERGVPDKAPPAPFRGAAPVLIGAFVVGIALSAAVAFAIAQL